MKTWCWCTVKQSFLGVKYHRIIFLPKRHSFFHILSVVLTYHLHEKSLFLSRFLLWIWIWILNLVYDEFPKRLQDYKTTKSFPNKRSYCHENTKVKRKIRINTVNAQQSLFKLKITPSPSGPFADRGDPNNGQVIARWGILFLYWKVLWFYGRALYIVRWNKQLEV